MTTIVDISSYNPEEKYSDLNKYIDQNKEKIKKYNDQNHQIKTENKTYKEIIIEKERIDKEKMLLRCIRRLIPSYDNFKFNVLRGIDLLTQNIFDKMLNETNINTDLIVVIGKNKKTQLLFNNRNDTLALLYNRKVKFFKDLGLAANGFPIVRKNIINFLNNLRDGRNCEDSDIIYEANDEIQKDNNKTFKQKNDKDVNHILNNDVSILQGKMFKEVDIQKNINSYNNDIKNNTVDDEIKDEKNN